MFKRKAQATEENLFSGKLHQSRHQTLLDRRCESGKNIDVSFIMTYFNNLFLCLLFQRLGALLTLSIPFYPNLMRLFFSGISPMSREMNITSFMKGRNITIKADDIAYLFELDLDGEDILDNGSSSTAEGYNRLQAMNLVSNKTFTTASRLKTSDLTLESRLLHWIVIHAIYPKSGSFSEVGSFELLIMWMILKRRKINLPTLILRKMCSGGKQASPLFYGMILTKIFLHFEVSMEGEMANRTLPSDTLNKNTLSRMGYFQENGIWKAKARKGSKASEVEEEDPDHIPSDHEAGPSGTAPSLENIMRALERLDHKVDARLDAIDHKVDARLDAIDNKLEDIYRRLGN